ncbi:hypothetical protein [Sphingomonas sp. HMP9]|uniref:hypothetical protein n=1 Tax=Sphingomonas sp. HMP9 TaxID=1517554 RepID=UPI0015969F28|nr:hypothetical protein [Sphingomonas sp. HMP9]
MLEKVKSALSGLNRIDSGIADETLSRFMPRRGAKQLITQMVVIKNELERGSKGCFEGMSAGIGRTIIENANDIAHPLASLCMEIQTDRNQLAEEVARTC